MKKKELLKKIGCEISRLLLGITFVFSGFVKAVDPHGFAYKIEDYLSAFNLSSFSFLSLPVSIGLCVLEFSLGIFILFGLYRKWSSRLILLVMLFMTPLTLYLAIANPVSDCGCFGDALIISNWETFFKNIILLLCAICVFFYAEKISNFFTGKTYWIAAFFTICAVALFSVYNSVYEPIIDFRPYKVGANLSQLTSVNEGEGDVYENVFVYEKDGNKQDFTETNYPWQDSTWTFVEMTSKLVKEGVKPAITDFEINQLHQNQEHTEIVAEEDVTREILEKDGYTFLMLAYSLKDMDETHLSKFEDVSNYASERDYGFYCLTSSLRDEILAWEKSNAVDLTFCLTDERTLKTMMRSNPGLLLLKDGVVVQKWADLEVPDEAILTKPIEELVQKDVDSDKKKVLKLSVLFLVPLVALKAFDLLVYRRRKQQKVEDDNNNL